MHPPGFDWNNPNYAAVYADRAKRLKVLQTNPIALQAAKIHYSRNPWDFVEDWGITFDPRALAQDRIASIPFLLWPKQREYLEWLYAMWRAGERGLVEKSRDMGITWLSVGFACSMFLFVDGFTAGFGSRKEELVDKNGDDKSIFEKVRFFLQHVPDILMPPGWNERTCSAYMRVRNPDTGAGIIGEAGDEIGRGGRTSIYFVDEAAFITHQEKVDKALSQNTNCQMDISTPNGSGNAFYKKAMRFDKTHRKFVFDWRDDPRKNQAWYDKQLEEQDEVTVAQEIDRDYNASQEDVFINSKFVSAAVDAHKVLGFSPEGVKTTGFDIADTGDAKATINRHGSVVCGGAQLKKGNITQAIPWAFQVAELFRADALGFDGDGMGAPVMKVYLQKLKSLRMKIMAYHGSAGVDEPDKPRRQVQRESQAFRSGSSAILENKVKSNAETFANFRAQSWTHVQIKFENTYNAIEASRKGQIVRYDPEDLISIDKDGFSAEDLQQLLAELSRPKRIRSDNGKILVESKKAMAARGVASPNMADALVIAYSLKAEVILREEEEYKDEYIPYEQSMDGVI